MYKAKKSASSALSAPVMSRLASPPRLVGVMSRPSRRGVVVFVFMASYSCDEWIPTRAARSSGLSVLGGQRDAKDHETLLEVKGSSAYARSSVNNSCGRATPFIA